MDLCADIYLMWIHFIWKLAPEIYLIILLDKLDINLTFISFNFKKYDHYYFVLKLYSVT